MSARNHEVTAKQQLLDANGNIAETVLDAFPMGKLQMPTNSSEGDIVYEKKNLRLKYVLEKNPENLSERSAVGKSIAGKEKTGRNIIIRHIICEFDNFYQGKPFSCDIRLPAAPKWIRWSSQHRGTKKEDSIITRKSIVCARKVLQNIMESGTNFTRKNISERSTGDEVCGHMITLGTGVPGTAM